MKVEFWCKSGANIHSTKREVVDTEADLGYEDGEREALTDDDKYKEAEQWAWNNGLDIGYKEL